MHASSAIVTPTAPTQTCESSSNFQGCVSRELVEFLDAHSVPLGEVRLWAIGDLSLSGESSENWVVATPDRVVVVADEAGLRLVRRLAIEDVEAFRVHGSIGSGFLQAYVDGAWEDLARFSNALARRFHELAEALESVRTTGVVDVQPAHQREETHCSECGIRLPPSGRSCPRCQPRTAIAARLWRLLRPRWPAALGVCGLTMLGVALELVPPKLQQYLVDDVLARGDDPVGGRSTATALLAVVLALAAGRVALGFVGWMKGALANEVGVAMTHELRAQLVRKLHSLGMAYHDRHQVGSLVSRVGFDTEVVHGLLQQVTGGFLLQIVQVIAVGAMLFTIHPGLAILTLIPAPLVIAASLGFWRRIYPSNFRYWEASGRQAGGLSDMLSGMRVIKAYGQEEGQIDRQGRASEHLRRARLALEKASTSYSATMVVLFGLGGLIVWYAGGRFVLAGRMTLGSLIAFLAYLAMFYAPLSTLSQLTTWLTSFLTGCQRVFDLIDTPSVVAEPSTGVRLTRPSGAIRFEDVTFGYEPRRPAIRGVSFAVRPGEKVGIVGRSGSGKTTIANLIGRLYDVETGRVTLDGVDVRDLDPGDLRRAVGVVLQEPFLFRATIGDNLGFGRPDAGPEAVIAAAFAAQAHHFIATRPLGYDTWLGERGAGLSGGEKQRVCLARALLCDPSVLILDESSSSVDPESEEAVQKALRVLTRGRTTLVIAHHLNTLRDVDRILVLDEGRLIEEGSPEELLRLGGLYAKLAKIQNQDHPRTPPASWEDGTEFAPSWLEPDSVKVRERRLGSIEVELPDGTTHRGVAAVRCFPATRPDEMISLRTSDRDGRERELGIVRRLDTWPARSRELFEASLGRRYRMRRILGVEGIKVEYGNLAFTVRTDQGIARFIMRWNENHVQDFGGRGKLI